jgi:hypothetical protein
MALPARLVVELRQIISEEYHVALDKEPAEELAEGLLALAKLASADEKVTLG